MVARKKKKQIYSIRLENTTNLTKKANVHKECAMHRMVFFLFHLIRLKLPLIFEKND